MLDNTATKYDFLVTEVQDKITEWVNLIQQDDVIDHTLTLKEVYDKYLHPNVLPLEDEKTWETIKAASSLDLFQLDSDIGRQGAKKVQPNNMEELSAVNGLIRLMTSEKGAETPMEKYIRFRNNPQNWENEMDNYHLSEKEKEAVRKHIARTYGIGISQEQLMLSLMDPDICDFSLKDANMARKTVAKKQMDKIADLRKTVWDKAKSPNLAEYIWLAVVAPSLGYSFSDIHSTAYSFIGFQTAYIATHWNPIYWNTACLIVNSGSLNVEESKKDKTTDYGKIAKAIGNISSAGTLISLVDINKSDYGFKPDAKNNKILFGMKGLNRVGDSVIEQIINGRPYKGIKDFMQKCPLNKTVMISLIKAGAFDEIDNEWASKINKEPRLAIMFYYLSQIYNPKKRLTLQNFNGLIQRDLVPKEYEKYCSIFKFNKYLKSKCKKGDYFLLSDCCYEFYNKINNNDEELESIDGQLCIKQKAWDKIYKREMEAVREWLSDPNTLIELNNVLFKECYEKYAKGSISSWEMESLCFYYHPHELEDVNKNKYGIIDFNNLSSIPAIETTFKRNGKKIPIYQLYKIVGTVIGKNDTRSSVDLLTTSGVVNVKFTKDYFAMFNRQISEVQEDGSKKVLEKGWFVRGTKLMVTGFRRDDQFVAKTYARTKTHQLYLIEEVKDNGDLKLRHERY